MAAAEARTKPQCVKRARFPRATVTVTVAVAVDATVDVDAAAVVAARALCCRSVGSSSHHLCGSDDIPDELGEDGASPRLARVRRAVVMLIVDNLLRVIRLCPLMLLLFRAVSARQLPLPLPLLCTRR